MLVRSLLKFIIPVVAIPAVIFATYNYAQARIATRLNAATDQSSAEAPPPLFTPTVPQDWYPYVDEINGFGFAYPSQFLVDEGFTENGVGIRAVRSPYSFEHNGCALLFITVDAPGKTRLEWDRNLADMQTQTIGEHTYEVSHHHTEAGMLTVATRVLPNQRVLYLTYNACFSDAKREEARLETAKAEDLIATFVF